MSDPATHPIAVVARRTGLTQDLLRAWEKRYQAVVPRRTETGRRFYTDGDIERLRLLKTLVDGGRRISDVARLDLDDLHGLVQEDETEATALERPHGIAGAGGEALLARCGRAIDDLDREGLAAALAAAGLSLSPERTRREVLVPLIEQLGGRWESGVWRIGQEHLATAVVRAFLWEMFRRASADTDGDPLVVATLSGHRHELGALLAAAVAAEQGLNVIYLGPDLPAEEIAAVVQARDARAVLLSLVYPRADARTTREILELRALIGPAIPILAGGRGADSYREVISAVAGRVVADCEKLRQALLDLSR